MSNYAHGYPIVVVVIFFTRTCQKVCAFAQDELEKIVSVSMSVGFGTCEMACRYYMHMGRASLWLTSTCSVVPNGGCHGEPVSQDCTVKNTKNLPSLPNPK